LYKMAVDPRITQKESRRGTISQLYDYKAAPKRVRVPYRVVCPWLMWAQRYLWT
jgi:hypothetical protein